MSKRSSGNIALDNCDEPRKSIDNKAKAAQGTRHKAVGKAGNCRACVQRVWAIRYAKKTMGEEVIK